MSNVKVVCTGQGAWISGVFANRKRAEDSLLFLKEDTLDEDMEIEDLEIFETQEPTSDCLEWE